MKKKAVKKSKKLGVLISPEDTVQWHISLPLVSRLGVLAYSKDTDSYQSEYTVLDSDLSISLGKNHGGITISGNGNVLNSLGRAPEVITKDQVEITRLNKKVYLYESYLLAIAVTVIAILFIQAALF